MQPALQPPPLQQIELPDMLQLLHRVPSMCWPVPLQPLPPFEPQAAASPGWQSSQAGAAGQFQPAPTANHVPAIDSQQMDVTATQARAAQRRNQAHCAYLQGLGVHKLPPLAKLQASMQHRALPAHVADVNAAKVCN